MPDRKRIKIKFQNGLLFESAVPEILAELLDDFEFVNSDNPDFIVFGPYGNDIPAKGKYTRVGYYCENIVPDMTICDWAFGVPREEHIGHRRYKRIQWHGLDARVLIKPKDYDPKAIMSSKIRFCNFLYSNRVPYREAFFQQLSGYKKVDAPGKSMNNMPGIDSQYQGNKWEIKKQFLSPYKFTIAFENDIFPGYQTEKLYDAMQANSIPIYCGDPFIGEIFNTKSFINAWEYLPEQYAGMITWLTKKGQMDFEDMRPAFLKNPRQRVKRKLKAYLRGAKTWLQFNELDFSKLTEHIIEVDSDPQLYLQYLREPWFKNNQQPVNGSTAERWRQIFNS
ncbi:glycosyltransferase family 10 [Mucilaginibacter sp. L3T2-6]|uniref:glycosyltransferase family 10 domain-containing protein n=1 Tax=Mucilaginibacter sp. L3T2-6 TaxID=3062491 RepID=UPI00267512BE|nr:glycosyltransferase family 10 [Mucilaginibacter sp. L3T2-6]MDO3643057.1 glycosyltransferase family 10 [Mucilaginibacter sp. L3T2-6]MDV6215824.1 glycosyltransferase family 10 [Mucilaginibacter sp. L3T2-6]